MKHIGIITISVLVGLLVFIVCKFLHFDSFNTGLWTGVMSTNCGYILHDLYPNT